MDAFLLDSNTLIYASRPEYSFLDSWIRSPKSHLSAISIPEVLGFPDLRAEDEATFRGWFSALHVAPVTEATLFLAATLRRKRRMKLGDAIIAATALMLGAGLVTRNVDDFRLIEGLAVIDPFEAPERKRTQAW